MSCDVLTDFARSKCRRCGTGSGARCRNRMRCQTSGGGAGPLPERSMPAQSAPRSSQPSLPALAVAQALPRAPRARARWCRVFGVLLFAATSLGFGASATDWNSIQGCRTSRTETVRGEPEGLRVEARLRQTSRHPSAQGRRSAAAGAETAGAPVWTLSGFVVDEHGAAIARADVWIEPMNPSVTDETSAATSFRREHRGRRHRSKRGLARACFARSHCLFPE